MYSHAQDLDAQKVRLKTLKIKYIIAITLTLIFFFSTIAFFATGYYISNQTDVSATASVPYMVGGIITLIGTIVSANYFSYISQLYFLASIKFFTMEAVIIRGEASLKFMKEVEKILDEQNSDTKEEII